MIWFSSDHHFGHKNVIEYCKRPYSSVEEMNEDLIRRWNETVEPQDIVIYLGDFSLGKSWVRNIIPRLNGSKHLIAGNHDWCHPTHAKNTAQQAKHENFYIDAGFATVAEMDVMRIAGHPVLLSHLPFRGSGDHTELERYTEYRPIDKGDWLLCGHVHNAWKTNGRMINVGCDVWDLKPVSVYEIERLIRDIHIERRRAGLEP